MRAMASEGLSKCFVFGFGVVSLTAIAAIVATCRYVAFFSVGQQGRRLFSYEALEFDVADSTFSLQLDGDRLKLTMDCPDDKWCGIGFNTKPFMDGADVFTFGRHGCCDTSELSTPGRISGTRAVSLTQCNLKEHTITVDRKQDFVSRSYSTVNGRLRVDAERMLDTGDTTDYILQPNTKYYIIMTQSSKDLNVGPHGNAMDTMKFCEGTLAGGRSSITCGVTSTLRRVHAACMILAWVVLLPAGIFLMLFSGISDDGTTGAKDRWLIVQRVCNSLGWLLTVVGVFCIVVDIGQSHREHFSNAKAVMGLITAIIAFLQPLNALVAKATKRLIWEVLHGVSGWFCLLLALVTSNMGVARLWWTSRPGGVIAMMAWSGILVLAALPGLVHFLLVKFCQAVGASMEGH